MSWSGVAIFVVTYALISARRLNWLGFDRPAGALAGAVAYVAFRLLSPEEALAAIDGPTLVLLFGMMGMGAFLAVDGFFEWAEDALVRFAKTPECLLGYLVWGAGILSAFITNDAVAVLGAPVVVRLVERQRLPAVPFLLALATAANTGSVATLVGNPQNMLVANLGGLDFLDHLQLMGPVAILGLALNHLVLRISYRDALREATLTIPEAPTPFSARAGLTLGVIAAISGLLVLGTDLAFTAVSGVVALMLVHRRDTREIWPRIDWSLLLFFAGLFVVVAGFRASGATDAFFQRFPLASEAMGPGAWVRLSTIFLVGSNLVSNVPFILVVEPEMARLADPALGWELLAMASTFAGNLTLLGSVANVIVAEAGAKVGGFGFFEHLRVGLPVALATTLLGTGYVLLAHSFGGW